MIATNPPRIPISVARCPVHGSIVGRDGLGRLVGKCDGCAGEAADGLIFLRQNPTGLRS